MSSTVFPTIKIIFTFCVAIVNVLATVCLLFIASVNENSNLSTSVFHVQATDKDIGVNGKIAYSILSGNNEGHFSIDKVSGRIFTKAFLDYKAVQNYDLVVTAEDTKHTVRENLRIRVVNINDI